MASSNNFGEGRSLRTSANAKSPPRRALAFDGRGGLCADEIALLEAARAHVLLLGTTVDEQRDALDVGAEGAVDRAVRVGDGTAGNGVLPADIAYFRHDSNLHGHDE